MKKNSLVWVIGVLFLVIGVIGSLTIAGYFLWIGLIGCIFQILKRNSEPRIIYKLLFYISILFIIYFLFKLFISF